MPLSDRLVPIPSSVLGDWWSDDLATNTTVNMSSKINIGVNPRFCIYKSPDVSDTMVGWTVGKYMKTNQSDSEYSDINSFVSFVNSTITLGSRLAATWAQPQVYTFIRKTGRFDRVEWTGTGTATRVIPHIAGPYGLIMIKCTSANGSNWVCHFKGMTTANTMALNTNGAQSSSVLALSAVTNNSFTVKTALNGLGSTYTAVVFAGGNGVSQTTTYTGKGTSDLVLNFSVGKPAKLVLIKSQSAAGDWYIIDVPANTYWTLNTTNAPAPLTSLATPTPTGLTLKSGGLLNTKSVTYRYLAIF